MPAAVPLIASALLAGKYSAHQTITDVAGALTTNKGRPRGGARLRAEPG